MAKPIARRVVVPLPTRLIARAKRIARDSGVPLNVFLRRCIEGRVNQIEASRKG